jgi:hypothetical protein
MDKPSEVLEERKAKCERILEMLICAHAFQFDENLKSLLPTEQGLYAISRKQGPNFRVSACWEDPKRRATRAGMDATPQWWRQRCGK